MIKINTSKAGLAAASLTLIILGGCATADSARLESLEASISRAQSTADSAMSAATAAKSDAAAAQSAAGAAQDSANNAITTAQRLTESCCRK